MDNKAIQQQRMKGYFIEAAKKLVHEMPKDQLSVRKIASEAGYSYATLYNYFDNLDHLLWYVVVDILEELSNALKQNVKNISDKKQKLIATAIAYMDYFVENQNAFELLFLSPPGMPTQEVMTQLENTTIKTTVTDIILEAAGDEQKARGIGDLLTAAIHGYLMFTFTVHRYTREELHQLIKQNVDLLL